MQLASLQQNNTVSSSASNVVLIHGVFGRARNLGGLQRALSPYFNTIALDMRSHGKSPHGPLTYPDMAKDVLETLDALGLEKTSLVGHSMGGKVAMATALIAPERINRLLVADIAPAPMHHGQNALAQKLKALHLPQLHSHKELRQFLIHLTGDAGIAELIGQNIALDHPTHWTIGLDDIANSFSTIEEWPVFPTGTYWNGPTLFLRGGASPYVLPEHEAVIHHFFPQARIETLANAGHWLHIEQPQNFCDAMLRFLRESTPA